jgi:hypothetical protein
VSVENKALVVLPAVEQAIEIISNAVNAPLPEDDISWSGFLERISVPLRLSSLFVDKSRAAVGRWLVWGYQQFGQKDGATIAGFCREVRDGLCEMGVEDVPSQETLRAWYYTANRDTVNVIAEEDGFGMASVCLMADDASGDRALMLRASAKREAAERGIGQVTAARLLKVTYAGANEQEYALGLPLLVETVAEDGRVVIMAEWRDGQRNAVGSLLNISELEVGSREWLAIRYVYSLLHLRADSPK